jgi:hypothetical protein
MTSPEAGIVFQMGLPPCRVDILTEISGVTFDEAWPNRIVNDYGGMHYPVIGRLDLIRNKRAAGRPDDVPGPFRGYEQVFAVRHHEDRADAHVTALEATDPRCFADPDAEKDAPASGVPALRRDGDDRFARGGWRGE